MLVGSQLIVLLCNPLSHPLCSLFLPHKMNFLKSILPRRPSYFWIFSLNFSGNCCCRFPMLREGCLFKNTLSFYMSAVCRDQLHAFPSSYDKRNRCNSYSKILEKWRTIGVSYGMNIYYMSHVVQNEIVRNKQWYHSNRFYC